MSERAKIFQNGGSQAVRLPKRFRFRDEEVIVRQVGKQVILEPADEWPTDFVGLSRRLARGHPRPEQRKIAQKPNPFDAS